MSDEATLSGLVVGVDGSVASYAAVSWAAREATMRRRVRRFAFGLSGFSRRTVCARPGHRRPQRRLT